MKATQKSEEILFNSLAIKKLRQEVRQVVLSRGFKKIDRMPWSPDFVKKENGLYSLEFFGGITAFLDPLPRRSRSKILFDPFASVHSEYLAQLIKESWHDPRQATMPNVLTPHMIWVWFDDIRPWRYIYIEDFAHVEDALVRFANYLERTLIPFCTSVANPENLLAFFKNEVATGELKSYLARPDDKLALLQSARRH